MSAALKIETPAEAELRRDLAAAIEARETAVQQVSALAAAVTVASTALTTARERVIDAERELDAARVKAADTMTAAARTGRAPKAVSLDPQRTALVSAQDAVDVAQASHRDLQQQHAEAEQAAASHGNRVGRLATAVLAIAGEATVARASALAAELTDALRAVAWLSQRHIVASPRVAELLVVLNYLAPPQLVGPAPPRSPSTERLVETWAALQQNASATLP